MQNIFDYLHFLKDCMIILRRLEVCPSMALKCLQVTCGGMENNGGVSKLWSITSSTAGVKISFCALCNETAWKMMCSWWDLWIIDSLGPQMVGIGTSDVNLDKYRHTFCSLLGKDEESWGLSYTGSNINFLSSASQYLWTEEVVYLSPWVCNALT